MFLKIFKSHILVFEVDLKTFIHLNKLYNRQGKTNFKEPPEDFFKDASIIIILMKKKFLSSLQAYSDSVVCISKHSPQVPGVPECFWLAVVIRVDGL